MPRLACFLLIALRSFNFQSVFAQDQRVADSLAVIYQEGLLEGDEKLELLKDLAFNELNDGELSLKYAEELIRQSELENNSFYLFSGYLQKGEHYKKIGDLDLALEVYYKAVNIALDSKSIKDEGIAYISMME